MNTEKLNHIVGGSTETWRSSKSELALSEPAPLVILAVLSGLGTKELAGHFMTYVEKVITRGRPTVFDDWEKATHYETGARSMLAKWFTNNIDHFENTHILVTSPFLKMGVSVANVLVGGKVQVYSEREQFDRVLHECIGNARR